MKKTLPSFPQEGGCACGAVRYRLTAPPPLVYTCHCTDCQTLTHSAFTLSAPVPRENVQFTSGELKHWDRTTTESGIPAHQTICANCGVRIFSDTAKSPGRVTLRLGTLDDTSWVWPVAAIWMKSAQPWFQPPEYFLTAEKGDINWSEVGRRWQAQFVAEEV